MEKRMIAGATDFLVRWVLPPECCIWVAAKRPLLFMLIRLAVLFLLVMPLVFCLMTGVMLVADSGGKGDMFVHGWWCIIIAVAVIPGIAWLIRTVLGRVWKPTPEMLADNDAIIAAELQATAEEEAMAEQAQQVLLQFIRTEQTTDDQDDAGRNE